MGTTLRIDDDVLLALEQASKRSARSAEDLANEILRANLHVSPGSLPTVAFETTVVNTGRCALENVDNIHEVLAYCEGEDYR